MTASGPHPQKTGIIGAGISGLMCARLLHDASQHVSLFDKGRSVGGRLCSRRSDNDLVFDHGAQYFTVRDPLFKPILTDMVAAGVVAEWQGRLSQLSVDQDLVVNHPATSDRRYVGTPSMSAVPKFLSRGLPPVTPCKIVGLLHELINAHHEWRLKDDQGQMHGPFSRVIFAMPPAQILELLHISSLSLPDFAGPIAHAGFKPCWAVMIGFSQSLGLGYDAAFVRGQTPLAWVANNQSKRSASPVSPEAWTLHAHPDWSQAHLEDEPDTIAQLLADAFAKLTAHHQSADIIYMKAHRWRYALPHPPIEQAYVADAAHGLFACGDWCAGPRVEGAALSGLKLGAYLNTINF